MYWIQEYGQKTGANRGDFKLFYAENASDVDEMPTTTQEGNVAYALDGCEEYIQKIKPGDQVLILESSSVAVIKSDDTWQLL